MPEWRKHLPVDLLDLAAQVATSEPFGLVHLRHFVRVLIHHLQESLQPRTAVLWPLQDPDYSIYILSNGVPKLDIRPGCNASMHQRRHEAACLVRNCS